MSLWLLGRPLVCSCDGLRLWNPDATGAYNSQHLVDWYSGLHVIFGMLCFALMWTTSRHWPIGWLFVVAVVASSAWEIAENTPFVIALFGHSPTGALYRGDSLPNSLSDMLFMLAGFWTALRLPALATTGLAIGIETVVALSIHDSLIIGLFQLAAQIDAGGYS